MDKIKVTVGPSFDGRLIKDFLRLEVGLSATLIKKVKFGGVFVNGVSVTMRKLLAAGDSVEIILPIEDSQYVAPIDEPLSVNFKALYLTIMLL